MLYFECPNRIQIPSDIPSVFLAGGITDCPDWQSEVVAKLSDLDVALINPRRANFPIHDPGAADEQIRWEYWALRAADLALFWFPGGPSVQPIAMFELGTYAGRPLKPVVVGRDPGYRRCADIDIQMGLYRPGQEILTNLDNVCDTVRAWVA